MATINFFLQGKGGCGKSTCANFYTQYLLDSGKQPHCYDNDPVNCSLMSYERFKASSFELVTEESEIRMEAFDDMMRILLKSGKDDIFIIDNGASVFFPLLSYMVSSSSVACLEEEGHHVFFHCPIIGGGAMFDTYNGFKSIAEGFPDSDGIIVWLNTFWGEIHEEINGEKIGFTKSKLFMDYRNVVKGVISLPKMTNLMLSDYEKMTKAYSTFEESCPRSAENSPLDLMQKSRMRGFRDKLYSAIYEGLSLEDGGGQS